MYGYAPSGPTQHAPRRHSRRTPTQHAPRRHSRRTPTPHAPRRHIQKISKRYPKDIQKISKYLKISQKISHFSKIYFLRSILLNIFEADFFPLHCTSAKKRMAPHPQNQCCQAQDCETHLGSIDFFGGAILFFRACTRGAIF